MARGTGGVCILRAGNDGIGAEPTWGKCIAIKSPTTVRSDGKNLSEATLFSDDGAVKVSFDRSGLALVQMEFLGVCRVEIRHEDFESFVLYDERRLGIEWWRRDWRRGAR